LITISYREEGALGSSGSRLVRELDGSGKRTSVFAENEIVENASLGGAIHWGKCCFGVVHYEVASRFCQWT
jgi:hypothetical protein